ncbi:tigger transposable element-derived protein 6-like [Bactrocera tryoni]|uniref:tigger transposable element-derived protein 6-like n=1 Tax=Bactrocera tryoni TaxID=59916 RepID=UPI001A9571E7|nr:tigger transposable element-derived protein 6-like [Bactrocera tryoni]XP_039967466.1 tigger transposable element-derived protein 6-like [Bactrocera tryoni]
MVKNNDLYLSLPSNTKRKRQKLPEYPELEKRVLTWFLQCRESNTIPVGGNLLKEKAKVYAAKLGLTQFNASNGWLDNFKKRNNVSFKKVCGESAAVDDEVCVQWRENIQKLIENYEPKNIFNADETGLFYKCLSDRTLSLKGQSCHGGKLSKDRLTLLLAANMDGSEKFKPLMIGKSMKPRCFKNIKTFPMLYRANSKSWMTRNLFLEWLQLVNQQMKKQNRKILLFIDNCTAHTAMEPLSNVQTEFLPPNTTSVLQPLDKGVIKSFKTLYRKEVVVKLLESIEEKNDYSISIYDAMNIAHKAWTNISKSTIKNCFRACGFVKDQNVVIISEDVLHIAEWARVPKNAETRVNFDDFIHVDDELVITGSLNDDEFLGFENIDDENDETFEIP